MGQFPEFMRNHANRIATESQYTKGIEGYVYDGVDGSQMAFWTNPNGGISAEHNHPYDEYTVVVEGQYTMIIEGKRFPIRVGEEFFVPKGTLHSGESIPRYENDSCLWGQTGKTGLEYKIPTTLTCASFIFDYWNSRLRGNKLRAGWKRE